MILLSRLVMLAFIIVLLVFCMSNLDPVVVRMLNWESPPMPLFLVLLFLFFFGFFLALVWQALHSLTRRRATRPAPADRPPIAQPQEEKGRRRWGLGSGKKADVTAAEPSDDKGAQKAAETVDKEQDKVNITEEPADSPAKKP